MKLPRKRVILAAHRWLGAASALFLLILAVTGLMLNHTERLGLDRVSIENRFILARYGMAGGDAVRAWKMGSLGTLESLAGHNWINGRALPIEGEPVGFVSSSPVHVLATRTQVALLDDEANLVEVIGEGVLPYSRLESLGLRPGGEVVLVADNGKWTPDAEWLEFQPHERGTFARVVMEEAEISEDRRMALLHEHRGDGVSLYRVLLDAHSGRLFGLGGRTIMDLSAVAILVLVLSGLGGWLRRPSAGRTQNPASQ